MVRRVSRRDIYDWYYFDNGNTHHWICDQFTSIYCWGHFGDSEFIIQRIAYDPASSHWKLASATLSAHYGENDSVCGAIGCDHTANVFAGRFEYPTKRLHYPRVYVALNKHANYYSRGDCNSGGAGGSDDCTYNVDLARVDVNRYRNVGNNFYPRITSTQSTVNPTLYWGTEYFWNNGSRTKFCGWDGPSQSNGRANCSTGYEEILYDFGFGVSIQ